MWSPGLYHPSKTPLSPQMETAQFPLLCLCPNCPLLGCLLSGLLVKPAVPSGLQAQSLEGTDVFSSSVALGCGMCSRHAFNCK